MVALCAESDVWSVVASGSCPNAGRLCASALATGDVFELDCHGFADGTAVRFRAEDGGSLPAGVAAGTTYYVASVDESRFQVSTTDGGAAVNLTTDGSLVVVLRDRPVAYAIEEGSSMVIGKLRGNAVPTSLDETPTEIRHLAALYAARALRSWSQRSYEDLAPLIADAEKQLAFYMRGIPLRGSDATAPSNLAVARSFTRDAGLTRDTEVIP